MPEVANLAVVVTADTTSAERGLSDLGTKVSGVGSAITGALGGAAVAAVAGLGVAFVGSVKSAADFEKQMSAISAVTGSTETEMQALTSTALQLGKDTSFSASEAAAGMEELAKAGVSVADIIGGAGRAALDLAAAGAVSVADAAEIASNAMNVFNIEGANMGHVADVIAGAANASAIGVTDFKFSLAAAGAVAATAGIGFEDLSTAIAVMGQAGIKGSDAGTSLKTMMMNLQPSTAAQRDEFRRLGLETSNLQAGLDALRKQGIEPQGDSWGALNDAFADWKGISRDHAQWTKENVKEYEKWAQQTGTLSSAFFDSSGNAKSMSDIAQVLQDSLAGMTKQQQLASLEILFGSDAIRAAAVLAEAGAAGFTEMADAMGKVTAQAVAEERLNNLWGSLEKLKGSLETGAIMLGSLFTPALKSLADILTTQVNAGIAVLEKLPDMLRTVQQVMERGWETSDTIDPMTRSVGELAVAFRDDLWPAMQPVAAFVVDTLLPAFQQIGQFIASHPSLIAGLVAAWGTFVVLTTVVGWITGAIAAFGALSTAITASGSIIGGIIAILGGPLTLVILAVAAVIGLLVVAWTENWFGIQEITAQAVAFLTEAFNGLVAFLTTTWAVIVDATTTAWTAVSDAFTTGVATVQGLWQAGWDAVAAILTAAWNLLSTENQTRITELIALVTELWTLLPQLWTVGTTVITTLMTTWWAETTTAWTTAQTAISETVAPWWTTIQGYWDTALKAIQDALAIAWAAIVAATGTFFTDLGAQFSGAIGTLGQAATELGGAIMDALKTAINAKVQSIVESVTGAVQSALDAAKRLIGGASGGGVGASASQSEKIARAKQLAKEQGLDPELFAAQLMQESGFDVGATSGVGARGIGQFMPGTGATYAAKLGVTYEQMVNDADLSMRAAAMHMADLTKAAGGDQERALSAYYSGPGGGIHPSYVSAVKGKLGAVANVPAAVIGAQRAMMPQLNQFGLQGGSLSAAEAYAFCGPAAAMWFAGIYGRMPSKEEAEAMAREVGWTEEGGMRGPASQQALLAAMGVTANVDYTPTPAEVAALAAQNVPFQLSTAGHYYQVQGGGLGGLNVGGSGVAAGGSAVMSLDQITALSGAMNGIITLAPQMGAALATSSAVGGTALQGLLVSATTLADGSTVAITEMGGQITASIVDSTGQVVATYGAMAETVTTQTATMAAGSLTSITNLGTGIMTSTTDAAGNVITTVTDMSGQVTSQYATLANGATLAMGDMAAGVLTSTTDLGTGVMTTVQDMSGNYITTITDLAGNVTSQYVSLGEGATQATAEMAASVTAETATMATEVVAGTTEMSREALTSVTDMGDGIITITRDASGEMVATITDMAGNVTSTYSTMSSDVTGTAEEMAQTVVETMESAGDDIQGAVEEWGSSIGDELESIASDAQDQAAEIGSGITDGIAEGIEDGSDAVMDAVREVVEEAVEEAKDEAESDSPSKLFARELGLPIAQGVAAGIEAGSGLVADASRGLVGVPEYTAPTYSGGGLSGGTETIILKIDIGGRVAEEIYVQGRELAVLRGRRTP